MLIEICNLGDHCFLTVNLLPRHSFVPEYCTRVCCRVFIGTERYARMKARQVIVSFGNTLGLSIAEGE